MGLGGSKVSFFNLIFHIALSPLYQHTVVAQTQLHEIKLNSFEPLTVIREDIVPYSSSSCIPVSHTLPSFLNSLKCLGLPERFGQNCARSFSSCGIFNLNLGKSLKSKKIISAGTLNRPKWTCGGPGRVWTEEESCQPPSNFLSPKCVN